MKNKNDHSTNFKLIIDSLLNYIKNNEKEKILDTSNFQNFFDINKIIEKDENTLLNLAKLLLFISTLSSKKEKNLSKLASISSNFQNEILISCQFFQFQTQKKVFATDAKGMSEISEISFFLSGGDFLHKKIEILDETIIKNSEMYNSILDKYEKQMAELRQNKTDLLALSEKNKTEIEELKQKLDEINLKLNNKNNENIRVQKDFNEYKEQKEKEIISLQEQIKNITALKEAEINLLSDKMKNEQNNQSEYFTNYKLNSEKINRELNTQNEELKKRVEEIPLLKQEIEKYKNYCNNLENENNKIKNEINICQEKLKQGEILNREMNEKINNMNQKFNSDPYYAREIMSKTLYDFALKMMSENN